MTFTSIETPHATFTNNISGRLLFKHIGIAETVAIDVYEGTGIDLENLTSNQKKIVMLTKAVSGDFGAIVGKAMEEFNGEKGMITALAGLG
ncbi:MAG: hypothetical protein HY514_02160 [Candidatus Aenigmarchaeota archaeon]|nr:hypothetical protein [Candidatus Aenigmarchaeota archaeon]